MYAFILEKRKDARKRKKQREKDAERGEGGADADEMAADDQLLSQVNKNIIQFFYLFGLINVKAFK